MTDTAVVVGLGNPGSRYADTRHNIGAMVVDAMVARAGVRAGTHKKSNCDVATIRLGDRSVILARPRTYMNESGRAVAALLRFYSATPADLIVVHDELDLDFGTLRLKRGGGEGGHNGLRSISSAISDRNYLRLRFGIGRPPGRMDPAAFVLERFSTVERKEVPLLIELAADAVDDVVRSGLEAAQNRLHAS